MVKYNNYERKYIEKKIIEEIEFHGEDYSISTEQIVKALKSGSLGRLDGISDGDLDAIVRNVVENSRKVVLDGDKCILNDAYKRKIEKRNNVAIKYIRNHKIQLITTAVAGTAILISAPFVVGAIINQSTSNIEEYKQSVIVYNDKEYTVNDLYAVYTPDNVYFCNRKLNQNNDSDNKEVYDYYDIKTGNKICSDKEDGFMIEKFTDLPFREEFSQFNNKMTLDEIENRMLRDYMVYGEEKNRRI